MKNEDFLNMFNDPNFIVNTQKYIDKYKKLIDDMNEYMKVLQEQINNEKDIVSSFSLMIQRIYLEYQRDTAQQMMNALKFANH